MPKNIVICCDGTGNEIEDNLSNVLKLFRILKKNREQMVYYDPGIGTIGASDPWSRLRTRFASVIGLMTGYGLDDNVLDAYRFLVDHYRDGDQIFLFGFSRGAYTVRALGGFLRLFGLLQPAQKNLSDYALTNHKKVATQGAFNLAWRFERVSAARRVPIKFIGVWDTVSSVIVPRPDRLYWPTLQTLPHTRTNPSVAVFRHAIAIDERRRMFRVNRWTEGQRYNPYAKPDDNDPAQDCKQVWFAGVHADIGGGYAEQESGAAKFALSWMIDEAKVYDLKTDTGMYNRLVLGHPRKNSNRSYVAPDVRAKLHDSMRGAWPVLEVVPKRAKWREWTGRGTALGLYLPLSEPRRIPEDALIHHSVLERMDADSDYRPPNLPPRGTMRVEPPAH